MALCPFAVVDLVPANYTQARITPTTLIFHEAVSQAEKLRPGPTLEWHFYIGRSGTLYQFMDTSVRADANVKANAFAISVETWDNGGDVNGVWNDAQLATAWRLAAWCCATHGIKKAPATTWNGGGIGGHNWFPTEWAGGPRACPGPNRSAQIRNVIIPYVAGGGTAQEDDMSAQFESDVSALMSGLQPGELAGLADKLDALTAKVNALSGGGTGPAVLTAADRSAIAKDVADELARRAQA